MKALGIIDPIYNALGGKGKAVRYHIKNPYERAYLVEQKMKAKAKKDAEKAKIKEAKEFVTDQEKWNDQVIKMMETGMPRMAAIKAVESEWASA